jgi:hypothetical protein
MRYYFCLVLISILAVSCKKGKKLPQTVYVQYDPATTASVSPVDNFEPFDEYDIYEVPQSPSYVHDLSPAEIATRFNEDLAYWLSRNNIQLTTDPALYLLDITSLQLSESLSRQSYVDSCSSSTSVSYVYYSDISFTADASLYKNGVLVDSWSRWSSSSEKVRNKTNKCNEPKIRGPLCGPSCLIERIAKEVRMKVSRKIYDLEGY